MSKMVSTRTGFGTGLVELAGMRDDVVTTSADTYRSFALNEFVEKYPDRYFEFGIAEQGMLTASAAMAAEGCCVFPWVTAPSSLCAGWSRYVHLPHIPTSM